MLRHQILHEENVRFRAKNSSNSNCIHPILSYSGLWDLVANAPTEHLTSVFYCEMTLHGWLCLCQCNSAPLPAFNETTHVCLAWTGMALASIVCIYGIKTASQLPSKRASHCWQGNMFFPFSFIYFAQFSILFCQTYYHQVGWSRVGQGITYHNFHKGFKGSTMGQGRQGSQREPRDRCRVHLYP